VFGGEADRLVQLDVAFETRGVDGRDGGGDRVALGERLGGHALLGPEPAGEGDHAVLTPNGPVAFGCGHSASSFHVRPPAGPGSGPHAAGVFPGRPAARRGCPRGWLPLTSPSAAWERRSPTARRSALPEQPDAPGGRLESIDSWHGGGALHIDEHAVAAEFGFLGLAMGIALGDHPDLRGRGPSLPVVAEV